MLKIDYSGNGPIYDISSEIIEGQSIYVFKKRSKQEKGNDELDNQF